MKRRTRELVRLDVWLPPDIKNDLKHLALDRQTTVSLLIEDMARRILAEANQDHEGPAK